MKTIIVQRYWGDKNQTLGNCSILGEYLRPIFSSMSLERGWRDNEQSVSCIPVGQYVVKLEWSNRFQMKLWEIKNVPNRSETKFHSANFWYQLNGCIALGRTTSDINRDGYLDVTSSKSTMALFHKAMGDDTEGILIVKNK